MTTRLEAKFTPTFSRDVYPAHSTYMIGRSSHVDGSKQDESRRWYVAAVRGELVAQYGFMEEEADKIIEAYKLKERLDIAPDAQLHMDIADTAREMRQEGFFEYAR